jgi:hypothetical protein
MARSVCSPSPIRSIPHEKNVPALTKASCPPIRLSDPYGHEEWPRHHQSPPCRWPETSRWSWNRPQVCPPHAGLSCLCRIFDGIDGIPKLTEVELLFRLSTYLGFSCRRTRLEGAFHPVVRTTCGPDSRGALPREEEIARTARKTSRGGSRSPSQRESNL